MWEGLERLVREKAQEFIQQIIRRPGTGTDTASHDGCR
jgi:hypothetical protein